MSLAWCMLRNRTHELPAGWMWGPTNWYMSRVMCMTEQTCKPVYTRVSARKHMPHMWVECMYLCTRAHVSVYTPASVNPVFSCMCICECVLSSIESGDREGKDPISHCFSWYRKQHSRRAALFFSGSRLEWGDNRAALRDASDSGSTTIRRGKNTVTTSVYWTRDSTDENASAKCWRANYNRNLLWNTNRPKNNTEKSASGRWVTLSLFT